MMICSEGTRDSRGAKPRLLRRVGLVLACLVGGLSAWAQPAAAQHVDYFWSVVQGSTTLLPGESVTLQLNAERDSGVWYDGGRFTVPITGWGASDSLLTNTNGTFGTENPDDTIGSYLGRKPRGVFPGYRALPAVIGYALQPKGNNVQELVSTLPDQGIDHAQLAVLNSGDPVNPDHFFRVKFVAGETIGLRIFQTSFVVSSINFGGSPLFATFTDASLEISVVPSSSVASLLICSAAAFRRRRR